MELKAQCALEAVLVSHAHLDHVRDLATIADNRCQNDADPLVIAGTKETIAILKKHFFNDLLWPDFSRIPNARRPAIRYLELKPEKTVTIAGYEVRAIPVEPHHRVLRVHRARARTARSRTAETPDRPIVSGRCSTRTEDLKALLDGGELPQPPSTPRARERPPHARDASARDDAQARAEPRSSRCLLYHIKPSFQAAVERECARLSRAEPHGLRPRRSVHPLQPRVRASVQLRGSGECPKSVTFAFAVRLKPFSPPLNRFPVSAP